MGNREGDIMNTAVYVVKVTKTQKAENLKVKTETPSTTELLISHKLRKSEIRDLMLKFWSGQSLHQRD